MKKPFATATSLCLLIAGLAMKGLVTGVKDRSERLISLLRKKSSIKKIFKVFSSKEVSQ